jgi:putative transposase
MLLSLAYLVIRGLLGLLVPNGQGAAAKNLEIVVLRNQLNVLRRQVKRPRFRLFDRVFLAAAARRLPRTHRERFLVTYGCRNSITCGDQGRRDPPKD